MPASAPATTARSRCETRRIAAARLMASPFRLGRVPGARSGGNPRGGVFDLRQRAMPFGHGEFGSAGARDAGTRDLGFVVLESLGHDHLNAMLRSGHRVADWRGFRLQDTWDRYPRGATIHIELDVDRRKDRVEHFGND